MGIGDKFDQIKGKAKEGMGDATDNQDMQAEGNVEHKKGKVKDTLDDLGDGTANKLDDN